MGVILTLKISLTTVVQGYLSVKKVGFTGGEINIGTNINYLNEFSQKRNSFSTIPFLLAILNNFGVVESYTALKKKLNMPKTK